MDAIVKYPNRWTAGVSGNPNGRPVGSRTTKQASNSSTDHGGGKRREGKINRLGL
jgi:hypothetical protein